MVKTGPTEAETLAEVAYASAEHAQQVSDQQLVASTQRVDHEGDHVGGLPPQRLLRSDGGG